MNIIMEKSKTFKRILINSTLTFCLILLGCDKVDKQFYENGKIKSEITKNRQGNYDGAAKFYNPNGNIEKFVLYENGLIKECSVFYASGKLKWISPYNFNLKDGRSKEFYEEGGIKKEIMFVKGEKTNYLEYDSLGNLIYKFAKIDPDNLIAFDSTFVQIHDPLSTDKFVLAEIQVPNVASSQIRLSIVNGEIRLKQLLKGQWEIKKNVKYKPTTLELRILLNESTEIYYGSITPR